MNKRWSILATGLVSSAVAVDCAVAAPVMAIMASKQLGQFEWLTSVSNTVTSQEWKFDYKVSNYSSENIPDNNLIELIVPAGANQGVYAALENSDSWDIQIEANRTVFSGDGEFIPVLSNLIFSVFVPEIQPEGTGFLEASAAGNGGTLAFNSVQVICPITIPFNYVPLSIIGNEFSFDTAAGKSYQLYYTTNLAAGFWTTELIISSNGASVLIPFDLDPDAGFYKVEEL